METDPVGYLHFSSKFSAGWSRSQKIISRAIHELSNGVQFNYVERKMREIFAIYEAEAVKRGYSVFIRVLPAKLLSQGVTKRGLGGRVAHFENEGKFPLDTLSVDRPFNDLP